MLITAFNVDFGREATHNILSIISGNSLYRPQIGKLIGTAWTLLFWR
jgi:hypothetical protein